MYFLWSLFFYFQFHFEILKFLFFFFLFHMRIGFVAYYFTDLLLVSENWAHTIKGGVNGIYLSICSVQRHNICFIFSIQYYRFWNGKNTNVSSTPHRPGCFGCKTCTATTAPFMPFFIIYNFIKKNHHSQSTEYCKNINNYMPPMCMCMCSKFHFRMPITANKMPFINNNNNKKSKISINSHNKIIILSIVCVAYWVPRHQHFHNQTKKKINYVSGFYPFSFCLICHFGSIDSHWINWLILSTMECNTVWIFHLHFFLSLVSFRLQFDILHLKERWI